jgi:hypothetical protein
MAVPSGTFQTFQAVGNREDLTDILENIFPTETPIYSRMKGEKTTAKARKHEWQTDELATPTKDNSAIEGDDAVINTANPTTRLHNHCQIFSKAPSVSGTQQATDTAGRKNEMAYQAAKRMKELKLDIEASISQNNAGTAGAAGTGAKLASLEAWLNTGTSANPGTGTSVGEGSAQTTPGWTTANGCPATAPTDSTSAGSVSENTFRTVIADTWSVGGMPSLIVCPPRLKQKISRDFAGIATRFKNVNGNKQTEIVSGVDLYVSDFGEHEIVASRLVRSSVIFFLDPTMLNFAYLRPLKSWDLAKTGDSDKKQMLCEGTLMVRNPKAHAKICDVSPTK